MQLGDRFKSLEAARDAIKVFVLDQGESYKTVSSDKTRYIIECKDKACNFRVRATLYKKAGALPVSITILVPHSCSPAVHYDNKQAHTVSYLIEHHRASIINNRRITAFQIRSDERLRFSNNINYKQAYRTIQAVLLKMYRDESASFAKFLAYAERFKAVDTDNYCKVAMQKETGQF
jgi:MuDR family transposase